MRNHRWNLYGHPLRTDKTGEALVAIHNSSSEHVVIQEGEIVGQIVKERCALGLVVGMQLSLDPSVDEEQCVGEELAAVGFVTAGASVLSEDPKSGPLIAKVTQAVSLDPAAQRINDRRKRDAPNRSSESQQAGADKALIDAQDAVFGDVRDATVITFDPPTKEEGGRRSTVKVNGGLLDQTRIVWMCNSYGGSINTRKPH